jgi:hypothetical protein
MTCLNCCACRHDRQYRRVSHFLLASDRVSEAARAKLQRAIKNVRKALRRVGLAQCVAGLARWGQRYHEDMSRRMSASVLALTLGSLGVPLRADLRIKVTETVAAHTATMTHYYKENCWRSDSEQMGYYRVIDSANKRIITVDLTKREYSIVSFTNTNQIKDPSQTIVIEIETRDTGEHRQMFGHLAHHFVTTERRHMEYPGKPPLETRETTTDGWYVDVPLPSPNHGRTGRVSVLTAYIVDQRGGNTVPKLRVTRNGSAPRGLPVWEKTGDRLSEVTEFSEAPLDESIFEPPKGFRRVVRRSPGEQLSWSDELLFNWQHFQSWLVGLFDRAY